MTGIPHRDDADAEGLGARNRVLHRRLRDRLADPVAPVHHGDGSGFGHDQGRRVDLHGAAPYARRIPEGAHDAVRLVTPEIRLHQ